MDEARRPASLEPPEEAIQNEYYRKQTPAVEGSNVLPIQHLNPELFYPQRSEKVTTTETCQLMACKVVE